MSFLLITFPSLLLLSVSIQQDALGSTAYIILFTNNKQGMCFWYLEGVIWYQRCLRVSDLRFKHTLMERIPCVFPLSLSLFPFTLSVVFFVLIFSISAMFALYQRIYQETGWLVFSGLILFYQYLSNSQSVYLSTHLSIYLLHCRWGSVVICSNTTLCSDW